MREWKVKLDRAPPTIWRQQKLSILKSRGAPATDVPALSANRCGPSRKYTFNDCRPSPSFVVSDSSPFREPARQARPVSAQHWPSPFLFRPAKTTFPPLLFDSIYRAEISRQSPISWPFFGLTSTFHRHHSFVLPSIGFRSVR